MDKFWSILAVPIGVALCFGPALLVWLKCELSHPPSENDDRKD